MFKNNLKLQQFICSYIGHNFQNYKKVKEDNYCVYRQGYCERCNQKDIYIDTIY